MISANNLPTESRKVVYLDFNVFVDLLNISEYVNWLEMLLETNKYMFPFSLVHIGEVNRIANKDLVNKHLDVIKKISKGMYIDFNDDLKTYTVRPRDPFEVYETINEVPKELINEIYKQTTQEHLVSTIQDFPIECYMPDQQYGFFAKMFRNSCPNISKEINNLPRSQAINYIEKNVFNGSSLEDMYELTKKTIHVEGNDFFGLDFFIDNTLYLARYRTPNKDLKRPDGLLSDHHHLQFAFNCYITISGDVNFRRKILSKNEDRKHFVMGTRAGLIFLLLESGIAKATNSANGEDLTGSLLGELLRIEN